MRVLQVVALLNPDGAYGGPARVALNQSAELIERGHDVMVAAGTRDYPLHRRELDGVPVRLFETRTLLPGAGLPGIAAPRLNTWFRRRAADFDVVHIHFGRDLVTVPVAATARRRRLRYVLQTHGMVIPSRHPLATPLDAMWTRRLLRDAKAVLFLTEDERRRLEEVACAPMHLVEIGNGVPNYPAAPPHRGTPEVLFVARMHARKRPLLFVDMARQLLDAGLDARFTLVGPDAGEGAALRVAIEGESRITWEGPLTPAEIPRRMAEASVYVLPSVREPYPMTVLEALSVGLPVVINTDCGLAPLVQQSGCGIVTDGRVSSLAASVTSLLTERILASAMSARAREVARGEFGMHAVGERLLAVYGGGNH